MSKACGNPKCCASTGIHDGMTFGHGRLDELGYWEFPCRPCAKQWDETKPERIQNLKNQGITDESLNSIDFVWVDMPGWPYDDGPYPIMPPDDLDPDFDYE